MKTIINLPHCNTLNISDVNKRFDECAYGLEESRPDAVCLRELKVSSEAFPPVELAAGYGAVWRGQRACNGVAILARGAEPVLTRRALPGDSRDVQARDIEVLLVMSAARRSR